MVDCPEPCTKAFYTTYGIPCHHQIAVLANDGKQVGPEMFAKQWWLVRRMDLGPRLLNTAPIENSQDDGEICENDIPAARTLHLHTIFNPPIVNVGRRTIGTNQYHVIKISSDEDNTNQPESQLPRFTGEAGTLRRLPSQFEYVEGAIQPSTASQQGPQLPRATPKCSICRRSGHRKDNCSEWPGQRMVVNKVTGIEMIDATLNI